MNGFHDAANSIATVVSTGVLKPQQAIVFAAFFNVVAIAFFQLKVAATIGKGIVEPGVVDHHALAGPRARVLHLGRDGCNVAQPLPTPLGGLIAPLSSRPMNFFAVLLALLCEQLKPLRHACLHLLLSDLRLLTSDL